MSGTKQTNAISTVSEITHRYEALIRDFGLLRQLEEVAERELSPSELLTFFAGLIGRSGLSEHCSIMLLDAADAYLELRTVATRYASRGFEVGSESWCGKRFAVGEGVAGKVAATGTHVRVDDVLADPSFLPLPDSTVKVRSLMCFPLKFRGVTLGVVNLSHGEPEFFDIERETAMDIVAMRMGSLLGEALRRGTASDVGSANAAERQVEPGGVLIVRAGDGRILDISEHCRALTGIAAGDWTGGARHWEDCVRAGDRDAYAAYVAGISQHGPGEGISYGFSTGTGVERRLHEIALPAPSVGGGTGGVVSWVQDALAHDVLCRCFSESAASHLLHAQRVHTMGALANGVIHDLNNLLTGVVGNLDLALGSDSLERAGDLMYRARTASLRGAKMVNNVLKFGRSKSPGDEIEPVTVRLLLDETASILQCSLNPRIKLHTHVPRGRSRVRGAELQLVQALVNLGINARDALEHSHTRPDTTEPSIRLGAELVHLDDTIRGPWKEGTKGDFVRFYVADNGPGMSPNVLARIFEPFFSEGRGANSTGLGLPTVKRIVEGHDGWLDVHSTPGKGTTVDVYLPALPAVRAEGVVEEPRATVPPEEGACILLVDDEPLVRNLGKAILRRLGYRTISAASGGEALERYRAHVKEIDLVLLDLHMPDMDGETVFEELRKDSPTLPVVFSTGRSPLETQSWRGKHQPTGFLNKPYLIETMSEVIREALSKGAKKSD